MIGNIAQPIKSLYSMHEILNPISNPPKVLMWSIKSFCRESFWDESLAPCFLLVAIAQFAPREMTATEGDASDGATMTWNRKEVYWKSFLLLLDPHTRLHILMNERIIAITGKSREPLATAAILAVRSGHSLTTVQCTPFHILQCAEAPWRRVWGTWKTFKSRQTIQTGCF